MKGDSIIPSSEKYIRFHVNISTQFISHFIEAPTSIKLFSRVGSWEGHNFLACCQKWALNQLCMRGLPAYTITNSSIAWGRNGRTLPLYPRGDPFFRDQPLLQATYTLTISNGHITMISLRISLAYCDQPYNTFVSRHSGLHPDLVYLNVLHVY